MRGSLDALLRADLVPVEEAAATLGIEPKRLCGFIARNGIGDPIGSMAQVYGWSCAELAKRADAFLGRIYDGGTAL